MKECRRMKMKNNVVGWFEIPVTDMDRAVRFYETVFDLKLSRHEIGSLEMAWFPMIEGGLGATGSLVKSEFHKPSDKGVRVYFTAHSGDVAIEAGRVKAAGGEVLLPKTLVTEEIGYMAVVMDSEGNQIALHSRKQ
jgi:predicted enzyme related to lactoylglutathione lyase